MIATLTKGGVSLDTQNWNGLTALHVAAHFGQTRTAQFLMRVGANKRIRNHDGKQAAEIAFDQNYVACAQAIAAFATTDVSHLFRINYVKEQVEIEKKGTEHNTLSQSFSSFNGTFLLSSIKDITKKVKKKFKKFRAFIKGASKEELALIEIGDDIIESDNIENLDGFEMLTAKSKRPDSRGSSGSDFTDRESTANSQNARNNDILVVEDLD